MSTATDYLSALPVELISAIISFQDYYDRERCRFLSKFLYRIYKSTRVDFRLNLDSSKLTDGVSINTFVDRDKLDIILCQYDHVNETDLEAYLRAFSVFELCLSHCQGSILNTLFSNGLTSLFIRNMDIVQVEKLDLNSLQALPTLAPNLECLEIGIYKEWLFTGTEPFTNLKTLCVISSFNKNVLTAISSITKKMPSLTGLIIDVNYYEKSQNVFVTPPNLEYFELLYEAEANVPISATTALTQLHVVLFDRYITIEHPQPAPLSNVEIFGFVGNDINLYSTMEYYGIGDNLKTLRLVNGLGGGPLEDVFNEDQVWKRCCNLEYLLTNYHDVLVESLVHVASICTKLRVVSFDWFLANGEFNTQLLSKTGIKNIFLLRRKLPDEELHLLLDSGIDVFYGSERFSCYRQWPKRRCLYSYF